MDDQTRKVVERTRSRLANVLDDLKRLEKASPEGAASPSGWGGRSRPDQPDASDSRHSSAVGESEEGVELWRIVRKFKDQAASYVSKAEEFTKEGKRGYAKRYLKKAAVAWRVSSLIEAALRAEPLTKSECSEDESAAGMPSGYFVARCPKCKHAWAVEADE